jgi:hypothetical protein
MSIGSLAEFFQPGIASGVSVAVASFARQRRSSFRQPGWTVVAGRPTVFHLLTNLVDCRRTGRVLTSNNRTSVWLFRIRVRRAVVGTRPIAPLFAVHFDP